MKVIYGNSKFHLKKSVVALGIFDGLHRGHQFLLKKMLKQAKASRVPSVVVTFFPHPVHVLRPDLQLGYLISLAHRFSLLQELGVDYCYVVRFNKSFARIEPVSFVEDFLIKRLHVADIYVGADFRFGRDRMGDINLFKKMSKTGDYQVHEVKPLKEGAEPISSTRLRALVTAGDLKAAAKLLGRPFSVLGEVIKGQGRGKQLGYPTANVAYANDIMPPNGVYVVRVVFNNKIYKGAANLGTRPTFKNKALFPILEVYILDFKGDLYGKIIDVEFVRKIRDEQRFSNIDDLIFQIKKDITAVSKIFK